MAPVSPCAEPAPEATSQAIAASHRTVPRTPRMIAGHPNASPGIFTGNLQDQTNARLIDGPDSFRIAALTSTEFFGGSHEARTLRVGGAVRSFAAVASSRDTHRRAAAAESGFENLHPR